MHMHFYVCAVVLPSKLAYICISCPTVLPLELFTSQRYTPSDKNLVKFKVVSDMSLFVSMTPSVRVAPFSVHWTVERGVVLLKQHERMKEVPRGCVIGWEGSITESLKLTEVMTGTREREEREREIHVERERGKGR